MTDSKKIDDGGPAFPCSNEQFTHGNPNVGDAWSGLSLRDWFAGKAMQGICAHSDNWGLVPSSMGATAYEIADAMLIARKGGAQ